MSALSPADRAVIALDSLASIMPECEDVWGYFTCHELDTIAEAMFDAGYPEVAALITYYHAAGDDDEEDRHVHIKDVEGAMAYLAGTNPTPPPCLCPEWVYPDDFDGPDDHADACSRCPKHGH